MAEKVLVKSLETAVELAKIARFTEDATKNEEFYASGFAAYETWCDQLVDDLRFEEMNEQELSALTHPNAWCYYSLLDARAAAARYLSDIERDFEGQGAVCLHNAARLYEQIAAKLCDGQKHAPFPSQLNGRPWTREMRHAQAAVLKEALESERLAVAEIEKLLTTIS